MIVMEVRLHLARYNLTRSIQPKLTRRIDETADTPVRAGRGLCLPANRFLIKMETRTQIKMRLMRISPMYIRRTKKIRRHCGISIIVYSRGSFIKCLK